MSRPRARRPVAKTIRPLSHAEAARLKAMREDLYTRCLDYQSIVEAKRREAALRTSEVP